MCWASYFQNIYLHDLIFKARMILDRVVGESENKQERWAERGRRKTAENLVVHTSL